MIEWNIQSRGHHCQACEKRFAEGDPFHTLLFDQKQCYERLDVCEACWNAQFSQGATDRKGFVSHWQSVYSAPPAAPPDPIQKETAESLIRKLIELNDPRHAGALFILAVMLERKRLFRSKAQINQDGQRAFVYEHVKTGDLFTVPEVQLQLDQLDEVQRDVAHLLEHGLNPANTGAVGSAPAADLEPPAEAAAPETNSVVVQEETTPVTPQAQPAGEPSVADVTNPLRTEAIQ